jgi:DNA-directed RNA polymerase subunit N (RpoN/RPB10)
MKYEEYKNVIDEIRATKSYKKIMDENNIKRYYTRLIGE